jgi:hypothetical protein
MSTSALADRRQAATPKHNVKIKEVASRSIETKWLTRVYLAI